MPSTYTRHVILELKPLAVTISTPLNSGDIEVVCKTGDLENVKSHGLYIDKNVTKRRPIYNFRQPQFGI